MKTPMKRMLLVGENWLGSSARALREALERIDAFELEDFSSDFMLPRPFRKFNRILVRLTSPFLQAEYQDLLRKRIETYQPHVLLAVKAPEINRGIVEWAKSQGVFTVNFFPDLSPFAHGKSLAEALGTYDLVVSTKQTHPELWRSQFKYQNECIYVGHGYDPKAHLVDLPYMPNGKFDVCMIATWREEYGQLIQELTRSLRSESISIVVSGPGWVERRATFDNRVQTRPPVTGRSYIRMLRDSKIVIAPMTMQPTRLHATWVPPEQETTRSFQLAAANCFFLHQRTSRMAELYDEAKEVPLWSDAAELADLILKYLPNPLERARLAENAHRRAVPAYSYDARAAELVARLQSRISV